MSLLYTMSNRRYPFIPNTPYHIYNRGYMKNTLYHSVKDFTKFEDVLLKQIALYQEHIEVYIVCLLPNHFHIICRQISEGSHLSHFMRKIQGGYANYYKIRYQYRKQRGIPLYEGRFCARILPTFEDLIRCYQYVENNPIKHKLVENIDNRRYLYYLRPVSFDA